MTLIVSSELENRIQAKLDTGEYAGVEDLLHEALTRLEDSGHEGVSMAEFEAGLREAEEQADRGETFSGAEARAYLAARSAERMRG